MSSSDEKPQTSLLTEVALAAAPSVVVGAIGLAFTFATMPFLNVVRASVAIPIAPLLAFVSPFAAWHGVTRIRRARAFAKFSKAKVVGMAVTTGAQWHAAVCGLYCTVLVFEFPAVEWIAIAIFLQVILWVVATLPLSLAGAALFNRFCVPERVADTF